MKTISFLTLVILPFCCFSQNAIYLPSGRKLPYKNISINGIRDSLDLNEVEGVSNPYGEVYYKKLTNTPVFLFFNKKDDLTKIPLMLKAYDYPKHIYSYSYYYDLKSMMEKGTLTKSYLLDAFGKPSLESHTDEGQEFWVFKKNNARIEFENDQATKIDVINYRAYDLHQLAIFDFSVTGKSYAMGFDITFLNLGKKTIKYIHITVTATNPVDDKIGTKTLRAIGPVKPNDSGSYSFENTFYSSTAEYLSLDSIKIQYMDGTIRLLSKSQIKSIRSTDWEEVGNRTLD
ncbi:hypothetical protein [Pedobacter frigidisoli]|uniref:hypothetical protein n=1 Tax=Pedobacter frigidisoli TaxID=2530455 RepID=UPI0029318CA7|nr:hypothetical protein [Pedobacter frigidisoli]